MKRKSMLALNLALVLGVGSLYSVTGTAKAESIDEQRAKVQVEIQEANKEINRLQNEKSKLVDRIVNLNLAITDNNNKVEETKKAIAATTKDIKKLESEIVVLKERITKRTSLLEERARSFQENGGKTEYLSVVLGSTSFSDLIGRVHAVTTIVQADQDLIKEFEADKKSLETKQTAVQDKLAELEDTQGELAEMVSQLKDQKVQQGELVAKLEKEAQANFNKKGELEQKDQALAAEKIRLEIEKREREEAARKAAAEKAAKEAARKESKANETKSTKRASLNTDNSNKSVSESAAGNKSNSDSSRNERENDNNRTEAPAPKPAQSSGGSVVTVGNKYIGNSVYVFGGGRSQYDIDNGRFDCSGFVYWAFREAGIDIGPTGNTDTLKNKGTRVSTSEMQPGDLVFFDTYKKDGHVGIYVGNGKFIGSQGSTGVAIANMSSGYWAEKFNGRVVRI
ncbi:NlpC/P60 family protein [Metabacillus fastidiosus]|uniref:NlpC/P60 family protein n=1 Tax=Metabacillus fastidiosus TaxID=1458 RepID=A0ABU6P1P5_9BACI|nr:NlpC/P60 family protein [Metabacillus fastidiosus]